MSDYAVAAPPIVTLATIGDKPFPVHRIYCVGRNYSEHTKEMGGDPTKQKPFFFMKPADALLANDKVMPYPSATTNLHHELELVVALGKSGKDVPVEKANDLVWGYCVGIDMTRRDLQNDAKEKRQPWDMGKGFDHSAPCSALTPKSKIGVLEKGKIELTVNGQVRQSADLADMIWPVPDIIHYLSRMVELMPGDLIMTGTPAGVGPLVKGDKAVAKIAGLETLNVSIG